MRNFKNLSGILLLLFGFTYANNANAGENIAVLELYTAMGCGNTVPADKIFDKIVSANHKNLIAFSCHLTYFDNRVKDPHSQSFCDYRFNEYEDLTYVSTPQMIINGRFQTMGDKEHIVRDALAMAHSLNTIETVQLEFSREELNATLPQIRLEKPADVWLFAYQKRARQETVSEITKDPRPYLNIATHAKKLLENWDGTYKNLNVDLTPYPAEGYIVLAQYSDHTDILAAGKIQKPKLPASYPDQE